MKRQWLPPIIIIAFGLFIMGYVYFSPEKEKSKLISNNIEQTTIKEQSVEKAIPSISIDSLSRLGIEITLWTEGNEPFEKLYNVKLERVSYSTHSFVANMSGSMGEFDWTVTKQWMKWQGNKIELFTNYGNRFVVIGNYATLNDKLIFSGYLYKY